jgi:predicted nucleic acid-binding protein
MRVLVDTNVLIRTVQKNHPACRAARRALVALYRGGHELFLTTQNVAEFWNVCTRPVDVNGLGLSTESANRYAFQLERFFGILPDSIEAFHLWRKLVVDQGVMGVKVHDARLAAIMGVSDIQRILTFNIADFTRFPGIQIIDPSDVEPGKIGEPETPAS